MAQTVYRLMAQAHKYVDLSDNPRDLINVCGGSCWPTEEMAWEAAYSIRAYLDANPEARRKTTPNGRVYYIGTVKPVAGRN
jgi:hypothetical protein